MAREEEPVNFRPAPGMEDEWAAFEDPRRSAMWMALGVIPITTLICILLELAAMALLSGSGS
jgi:hypothetical protein